MAEGTPPALQRVETKTLIRWRLPPYAAHDGSAAAKLSNSVALPNRFDIVKSASETK